MSQCDWQSARPGECGIQSAQMTPREHIQQIRDVQAPPSTDWSDRERKLYQHHGAMGRNFLELIAEQLYTRDSHFALELLQNADDNSYPESVVPQLEIIVEPNRITFRNNEVGFSREQVESICNAGSSTKKQDKAQRIGEKGIGFKSVFLVSDAPEVHSSGYHFRFERDHKDTSSLIRPVWITGTTEAQSGTTIVLPLKDRKSVDDALKLFAVPENLLFLRRIRKIVIENKGLRTVLVLERHEIDANICEISTRTEGSDGSMATRFFTHRASVDMGDIEEKLRPGVTMTEVVVALPLGHNGEFDNKTLRSVYAFLPIKPAGLTFVTHADFVLTANREGIREGLSWNIRLRDQISKSFADAVLLSKKLDCGRTALRFVGPPSNVSDPFFQEVVKKATIQLRAAECIPCEHSRWSIPKQALMHDNGSIVASLLNDKIGLRVVGKQFVDARVQGIGKALELLDCQQCGLDTLKKCLKDDEFVNGQSPEWFGRMLAALGKESRGDIEPFKLLRILRLGGGETVQVADGIFIPSRGNVASKRGHSLDRRLKFLHKEVLSGLTVDQSQFAKRLLKHWGIDGAIFHTLIDKLIIPLHAQESQGITEPDAIDDLRYVRDHFGKYREGFSDPIHQDEAIRKLRESLRIRVACTSAGTNWIGYQRIDTLYLDAPYEMEAGLREALGKQLDKLSISASYIQGNTPEECETDRKEWLEFFKAFGAHTLPRILAVDVDSASRLSPEVKWVVESGSESQMLALLQLIAINWEHYASRVSRRPNALKMPDWCNELSKRQLPDTTGQLTVIHESCFECEAIRAVYGDSARCIQFDWKNDEFLCALGVAKTPTVPAVLLLLRTHSSGRAAHAATPDALTKMYEFLGRDFTTASADIKGAFEKEPLISCTVGGKRVWKRSCEVIWSLDKDLLRFSPKGVLSSNYQELKYFFTSNLGVQQGPTCKDLISMLKLVSLDQELDQGKQKPLALNIYKQLNGLARSGDDEMLFDCKDEWDKSKIFVTESAGWQAQDWNLVFPDDEVLADAFRDSIRVWFLAVPPEEWPNLRELFSSPYLRVRPISEAIELTFAESGTQIEDVKRSNHLRARWRHIVRWMFHLGNDQYRRHMNSGRLSAMADAVVLCCNKVQLDATCSGETRRLIRPTFVEVRGDGAKIWVTDGCPQQWQPVSLELATTFGFKRDSGLIIENLLTSATPDETLCALNVPLLPPEEELRVFGATTRADVQTSVADEPEQSPPENCQSAGAAKAPTAGEGIGVESEETGGVTAGPIASADWQSSPDGLESQVLDRQVRGGQRKIPTGYAREIASPSDRGTEKVFAKTDRLISYVECNKGIAEDEDEKARKTAVGRAAVAFVMESEKDAGRFPTEMAHLNSGYDIESRSGGGSIERLIEVKGLIDEWGPRGVSMSRTQFEFAIEHAEKAWLYIVERACDTNDRKLYRVRDPASRMTEFGIDNGWKKFAE